MRGSAAKTVLFSLLPGLVLLLAAESVLYRLDFTYKPLNRRMRFAFPDEKSLYEIYRPSPVTLWELAPGFNFPDSDIEGVNALGLRGPLPNPEACRTILLLGDSVVFGGSTSIAHELTLQWRHHPPPGVDCPIEVLNAGVPAFSSWQGRRWLETHGERFRPDVVGVLFGWNDHWWAKGYPDKDQRLRPAWTVRIENGLLRLKTYQLLARWLDPLRWTNDEAPAAADFRQRRVGLEDYRANLRAMADWCRAHGCRTLLLTSPRAVMETSPTYLTEMGFLRSEEDLAALHSQYNEVVRSLATEGIEVLDWAPRLEALPVHAVFNAPEKDVIHPNPEGYRRMAEWLGEYLETTVAFP